MAWYYLNQANRISSFYDQFSKTWNENGTAAAVTRFNDLRGIFNVNVAVSITDIVFSLVGLAGVDTESMKLFTIFTVWKSLQFAYSVTTSAISLSFYSSFTQGSKMDVLGQMWTLENVWSIAGLFVQLYFLIFIYLYLFHLRQKLKSRDE